MAYSLAFSLEECRPKYAIVFLNIYLEVSHKLSQSLSKCLTYSIAQSFSRCINESYELSLHQWLPGSLSDSLAFNSVLKSGIKYDL